MLVTYPRTSRSVSMMTCSEMFTRLSSAFTSVLVLRRQHNNNTLQARKHNHKLSMSYTSAFCAASSLVGYFFFSCPLYSAGLWQFLSHAFSPCTSVFLIYVFETSQRMSIKRSGATSNKGSLQLQRKNPELQPIHHATDIIACTLFQVLHSQKFIEKFIHNFLNKPDNRKTNKDET